MSCRETHDAHELGSFGPSHVKAKHATGFSVSFWLHPLHLLPKDGTRGTDTVWEVKLEGRGDGGLTTKSEILAVFAD